MTHAVRKRLLQLGYQVHTPGEVFGTKADAYGAEDTTWLAKVARTGWVVLNRDAKIMQHPHELAAYLAAKVHMFYLPGQATRAQLLSLVEANLEEVVTYAHARRPGVWRIPSPESTRSRSGSRNATDNYLPCMSPVRVVRSNDG